jgi:acetylornithine/N-succinyldiaminopimelate aminotransferase
MGISIERAEGCIIHSADGREYLDCISGISVASLGHSHPRIVQAVQEQAASYMHTMVYGEHVQGPQVRLARAITEVIGCGLDSVYFVNSGSEAIEAALKLAKRATGRRQTVSFKGAYHGSSHGALSLMGDQHFSNGYLPLVPGNTVLDYNDIQGIQRIGSEHAAVVVEVIQSESGYCPADEQFLLSLQERCRSVGSLLILDEIQTGFGRSGPLFAFQDTTLQPDMVAMAKAMGGGMPLGGIAASKKLMDHFTEHPVLGHITTFGGHPVSCAAALASLGVWQEEIDKGRAQAIERGLRKRLADIPKTHISGKGAMLALHLGSSKRMWDNVHRAWGKGLLIDWFLYNEAAFRLAPPLIITDQQLDMISDTLHELLA